MLCTVRLPLCKGGIICASDRNEKSTAHAVLCISLKVSVYSSDSCE